MGRNSNRGPFSINTDSHDKKMSSLSVTYRALSINFLILLLLWAAGCGYHFRETRKPIGIQIESLAIPLIKSTSSSAGLEADFTRIVREEFASHTQIPLVSEHEAAAVLIGRVYDITTEPLSYALEQHSVQGRVTTYETTRTRRLKIKLHAKLSEKATGKVIWESKDMEDRTTFSVGTDPLINRHNERKALEELARRLAKRIYLKTVERF